MLNEPVIAPMIIPIVQEEQVIVPYALPVNANVIAFVVSEEQKNVNKVDNTTNSSCCIIDFTYCSRNNSCDCKCDCDCCCCYNSNCCHDCNCCCCCDSDCCSDCNF